MRLLQALAIIGLVATVGLAHAVEPVGPALPCASLNGFTMEHVQIISATHNAAGDGLPGYCNVVGVIDKRVSAQDPDHFTYGIAFEVNLPDAWGGNFELMGGGGLDGSLANPVGFFGTELAQGWAVATDDGGHENPAGGFPPYMPPPGIDWSDADMQSGGTAHFGLDEQAREDYGFNAIERTALTSKALIRHYYGVHTERSYICGCSNGGRDAMLAAERFPTLFDGVVAANPGFDLPRAAIAEAWNEQSLAPLASTVDANGQPYLPPTLTNADLEVASAAILSACDALDGLVDGIVDDFTGCDAQRVYPALRRFTCSPNGEHGNVPHGGSCLTEEQVGALKRIFAGPHNSDGRPLYSGWYWDAGIWNPPTEAPALGWQAWNVSFAGNPAFNTAFNLSLGAAAVPMVFSTPPVTTPVNGPGGQEAFIFSYNFDTDAPRIFARTPDYPLSAMQFMAATSTDLAAFRRHGGKLIVYTSVNDGIFSGADLVHWYGELVEHDRSAAQFARLFMVPNMAHCGGGPATNSFAGNMLTAITRWVEHDEAPQRIVAANTDTVAPFPSGALFDPRVARNFPTGGTRPLCPYPAQSRYKGSGATNDAANFECVGSPRKD
ncbi:MAG TPA: tannase/feruloyl esterase family alpha/beta hydrolase [Steroidobacteraceae bacterium]